MKNLKKAEPAAKTAGMSDAAVQAKTGKNWAQWFKILDAAGAKKMAHREIACYLHERQKVPGWWAQMVTVGYERARGLRERHQKPEGYEISASKTIGVSLATLYKAWDDEKARSRWMDEEGIVIRKATASKSMRITWADGKSTLSVNFYAKGDGKSQVAVQHGKLPDGESAERMKVYWAKVLGRLQEFLEV